MKLVHQAIEAMQNSRPFETAVGAVQRAQHPEAQSMIVLQRKCQKLEFGKYNAVAGGTLSGNAITGAAAAALPLLPEPP